MFSLTAIVLGVCSFAAAELTWKFTNNQAALCNDFTRAGFFHRNVSGTEQKWVVFLESGSLCYSNETCNRRYFQSHIRERYSEASTQTQYLFGDFDTSSVWEEAGPSQQPLAKVVNPLMTSVYCFENETSSFGTNGVDITIEGRDILSTDCTENPTFCNHGHVLVPYCSSDMWLGTEDETSRQYSSLLKEEPCDCWDQDCFRYNPTSDDLQFTFRGQTIFRSVLQTLDSMYNLHGASEIVLVGSSAGGVGVLNSAKWMREEYQNVSIKVIADSSWFINFRDSIDQEFGFINASSRSQGDALWQILDSNKACSDARMGYPCCLSAYCLLKGNNRITGELNFPRNVPVFILTSLYDIFILAKALAHLESLHSDNIGHMLEFLMTTAEYGGAMSNSVTDIVSGSRMKLSYYATQCFQHVYLMASTLRERMSLLGTEDVIRLTSLFKTTSNSGQSSIWSSHVLAYYEGQGYTIRDAIHYWYWNVSDTEEGVAFRDVCFGPHCSSTCPEEFILEGEDVAGGWSTGAKVSIAVIVLTIAVICLLMKIYCCMWMRCLHWKQNNFLQSIKQQGPNEERCKDEDTPTTVKIEFPHCTDDKAISVACLDLHYSVSVNLSMEEEDQHHFPITLNSLHPEDKLSISKTKSMDFEGNVSRQDGRLRNKMGVVLRTRRKKILKGISAYFNPKELIAILGPSGCGKTTFLDLLTGRRKTGSFQGDIFINGLPIEENRKWYINNTGYVLQLAAPYYEELTVRENLTLAAWVKLHISSREKFQRVEQVMEVTGLVDLATTVVGGATGPGLSGGQKRRLVVALQLLKLPSVIFLDEPTSGLDSASSTELLTHLNALAASNRTVVLTIHQPRLEIFHMFHRIVVITDGKVAYHGVPEKAYEVFVNSLRPCCFKPSLVIPDLEDHNPADVIMDILGNKSMRKMVTAYYEGTGEQRLVSKAIVKAWVRETGYSDNLDGGTSSKFDSLRPILQGSRHSGRTHNIFFSRLAALEARAMKRATYAVSFYLPIIFFSYGFLLGTVYLQQTTPFLIISGFCVYSVASSLFMFPALYGYLSKALTIYSFEHTDGAGRPSDLIIQSFVRFTSMAFFPVIFCACLLYLLLINITRWNLMEFLQIALVNLALNHVWTALLILLIVNFPQKAFRLSPVLSAVAGFSSGFFIPISDIPWWYRWLCYINPNYYGFSASSVILLTDFESDCEHDGGSALECYTFSGKYILDAFNFTNINPYKNIAVLVGMTLLLLVMAIVSNWIKFLHLQELLVKFRQSLQKTSARMKPPTFYHTIYDSDDENTDEEESENEKPVGKSVEEEPQAVQDTQQTVLDPTEVSPKDAKKAFIGTQLRPESQRRSIKQKQQRRKALYLDNGEAYTIWKPKYLKKNVSAGASNTVLEMDKQKQDLYERQQKVLSRVQATREVLKVQREELATLEDETEETSVQQFTSDREKSSHTITGMTLTKENDKEKEQQSRKKLSMYFHNTVSQYVAVMMKSSPHGPTVATLEDALSDPVPASVPPQHTGMPLHHLFEDPKITETMKKQSNQTLPLKTKVCANGEATPLDFNATPSDSDTENN